MSRIYPDISGDLLQKIHKKSDLVPKQACVCGYKYKTTQVWVLVGLLLLSMCSLTGTVFMWCTPSFDNLVLNHFALKKESDALKLFQSPLTSTFVKVHIFNYTNVQAFMDGTDEKLKVKDIGPFVYERYLDRVNVQVNDNGTLTYQERSNFEFRPDLSKGRRQSDRVVVPDVPMLSAAAKGRSVQPHLQWGVSQLFKITKSQPFKELAAHRLLFGYDDHLYDIAKHVSAFYNPLPYDSFGLLANKNGTSKDYITINTGENGFEKYGYMSYYNGEDEVPHWSTLECRKIEGSDGSLFPPYTVRAKKDVYWYAKDFCRRMPMKFQKEVKIFNGTVSAYRYGIPDDVFDEPSKKHENQCYCHLDSSECPPQGVFNTTPCAFDAPTFMSFPHFYLGDQKLINAIEGLKPDPKIHASYLDLHPRLGYLMAGYTRIQVNIQVKKSFSITQLDRLNDDMMLPIAWMDIGLDETEINDKVMDLVYQTTFAVQGYELAFKYGFLLTHVMTLVFIAILVRGKYYQEAIERQGSQQRSLLA